jgi:cytochrome P450
MTAAQVLATSEALLIGGFVTTANIIGNGALALLRNPDQFEALRAHPGLAENAVEEVLRLVAPAQYSVRVARNPVSLAGHDLPAGTPIVLLLAAANRDPEVFPDPTRFDIARDNARRHLAFAAGIHYCIGAGLARMEGQIALRALVERFPGLRLAGRVRYCPSRVIRGPLALPVRTATHA